ncbi:hypothetical protein Tco_0265286 [Tanacetum coccineum]
MKELFLSERSEDCWEDKLAHAETREAASPPEGSGDRLPTMKAASEKASSNSVYAGGTISFSADFEPTTAHLPDSFLDLLASFLALALPPLPSCSKTTRHRNRYERNTPKRAYRKGDCCETFFEVMTLNRLVLGSEREPDSTLIGEGFEGFSLRIHMEKRRKRCRVEAYYWLLKSAAQFRVHVDGSMRALGQWYSPVGAVESAYAKQRGLKASRWTFFTRSRNSGTETTTLRMRGCISKGKHLS